MKRGLGDVLSGTETPSDFNQSVWDEWNAKSARAQADDALGGGAALESVPEGDRAALAFPMGPMQLPFAQFVRMRLNEHVLHTWDIGVMGDPTAQLPVPAAAAIVDGLGLKRQLAGKPTGEERTVAVHTTEPERDFTVSIGAEAVALTEEGASGQPERSRLPAEALVRLVYGRLDPEHTPPISGDTEALEALRRAFPGF